MSRWRKLLIVFGLLVLVLAVAAVVFVLTFDANRYRGVILEQLRRSVNRPVEAAELNLQLVPLRLRLEQVRILEDPQFAGTVFLRAEAVQFDLELWSLLRGAPQVTAIELVRPTVYLRQNASGAWNVATLGAGEESSSRAEAPGEALIRNWRMEDGSLVIERADQPALQLSGVQLTLTDVSATRRFPFRLSVSFSPESRVSAEGELGPLNLDAPARTPLEAELELENFRPAALSSLVSVPPMLARAGALAGTLTLSQKVDEVSLKGRVNLLGAAGGEEIALEIDASAPPALDRLQLASLVVDARSARINSSGEFTGLGSDQTRFDLQLATPNADLAALRELSARLGLPLPATVPKASGTTTASLRVNGTSDEWQLSGTATLANLAVQLEGLAQPLKVASLQLTFSPDRIAAAPFALSPLPGLTLSVAAQVDNYRKEPQLTARLTGEEAPLAPLLALAALFGKSPLSEGQKLSGQVRPDILLRGPLAEPAKLSYQGTLALREVTFSTPQLPEPVQIPAAKLALSPVQLSAEPFGARIGEKLEARVGFRLDDYQTKPRLQARLTTQDADLGALLGLARAMGTDPLPGGAAGGRVTTTIEVGGLLGAKAPPLTFSGQAQLARARIRPAALTQPLAVEQAALDFGRDRLGIKNLRAAVAGTNLQGSLSVQDFSAPRAEFDLRGDTLDLDTLQTLFATHAFPQPTRAGWREGLFPTAHAQAKEDNWFAALSARGRLRFEQVRRGGLTLAPFSAPVTIAQRVVTCDPIDFGLHEGGGRGRLVIDLRSSAPATEFRGLLRNVDANALLSAISDSRDRLYGRLGGSLEVRFNGSEWESIKRSAAGNGQLTLVNGKLAHISLSRELVLLGQLAGLRYERRDTPIEDMQTDFTVGGGWIRTNNLTLETPDLAVAATGGVSLEDALAFDGTAVFTREASQDMTSRSPLGALTGAVLKDDEGRVVVPFLVRGSFAQPKFSLDTKRLLEMRLGRGRTGPSDILRDILDRLKTKKPNQP